VKNFHRKFANLVAPATAGTAKRFYPRVVVSTVLATATWLGGWLGGWVAGWLAVYHSRYCV